MCFVVDYYSLVSITYLLLPWHHCTSCAIPPNPLTNNYHLLRI